MSEIKQDNITKKYTKNVKTLINRLKKYSLPVASLDDVLSQWQVLDETNKSKIQKMKCLNTDIYHQLFGDNHAEKQCLCGKHIMVHIYIYNPVMNDNYYAVIGNICIDSFNNDDMRLEYVKAKLFTMDMKDTKIYGKPRTRCKYCNKRLPITNTDDCHQTCYNRDPLTKLIKQKNELGLCVWRMNGKNKNKYFKDIRTSYFTWILEQDWVYSSTKFKIQRWLDITKQIDKYKKSI